MKVVAFHSTNHPISIKWWDFWNTLALDLVKELGDYKLFPSFSSDMLSGRRLKSFIPTKIGFDVAYIERFHIPTKRPAKFIYTMLDDYVGNEDFTHEFLERLRPDLLCSLHYFKNDLKEFCESLGIKFLYFPWFVNQTFLSNIERNIRGMMSGCVGDPYPVRTEMYRKLQELDRKDVVLSISMGYGNYALSKEEYYKALQKTRYYFSGGVLDFQIPLKYMEACSYGACLVSPKLPMMERCGFVPNESYIEYIGPEQIESILNSDNWKEIGEKGRQIVETNHTAKIRAAQIRKIVEEVI